MPIQFDTRISMGNLLVLGSFLVSASVMWGTTQANTIHQQKEIDAHQVTLDRYQVLFEKIQETQSSIVANNTMILQWLERNPPIVTRPQDK